MKRRRAADAPALSSERPAEGAAGAELAEDAGAPDPRRYRKRAVRKGLPEVPAGALVASPPLDEEVTDRQARKARAVAAYRETGVASDAARAAGVTLVTWRRWLEDDAALAADVAQAREEANDALEAEAVRRALGGSDRMMDLMLKARRPLVFRERPELARVSPEVQERLKRQAQLLVERLSAEELAKVRPILDEVWR